MREGIRIVATPGGIAIEWKGYGPALGLPPGPPGLGSNSVLPVRVGAPGSFDVEGRTALALGASCQMRGRVALVAPGLPFAAVVPVLAPGLVVVAVFPAPALLGESESELKLELDSSFFSFVLDFAAASLLLAAAFGVFVSSHARLLERVLTVALVPVSVGVVVFDVRVSRLDDAGAGAVAAFGAALVSGFGPGAAAALGAFSFAGAAAAATGVPTSVAFPLVLVAGLVPLGD
ncbi:MAG: hypothetical protein FD142_3195 [bacterium]|nr:MAG: hypothetical protein FD142_3195 [bacterium]